MVKEVVVETGERSGDWYGDRGQCVTSVGLCGVLAGHDLYISGLVTTSPAPAIEQ